MTAADRLVLVTGASGFVGRTLVPALAKRGWRVRAAARAPALVMTQSNIEPVTMPDLAAPADWRPLLAGVTHVVHLAGIAHSRARLPEDVYQRVNAVAAGELARAASASGVRRFVLMSSIRAQSGPAADGLLTEDVLAMPTDPYGRSKLAAESTVKAEIGARSIVLRPVLIIGPGVKGNLAVLATLAQLPVPLPFGALRNRRSLLGMSNLVSIIEFALTADSARGGVFLAADPEPMSVAALVSAMREAAGRSPRLVSLPPRALRLALSAVGRSSLADSLLGDLVVSTARLSAADWRPVATTLEEIARLRTNHI